MPLPSDIRAERLDGKTESDWSITGEVGGRRIELARVPYKGPGYDHAALAVLMAAGPELLAVMRELVTLPAAIREIAYLRRGIGTATRNAVWLRAVAAIQSATTIPPQE